MEVFEAPLRIRRRRSPGGGLEGGGEGGERGLEGRGGEGGLEGRGGEGGGLEGGGGGLQVEVPTASSQMVALRGRPQPHAHQR